MDVLPSALPEEFFLDASDECLGLLSKLIERGMAMLIQKYLNSPGANPSVKTRVENALGLSIRQVTFAAELREKGYTEALRNMTPINCSTLVNVQEMETIKEACDYIIAHQQLVRDTLPVRSKESYEAFLRTVPPQYKRGIERNRSYFFVPHASESRTGLGAAVRNMEDYKIMSKGLEIRIQAARSNRPNWGLEVAQV